MAVPHAHTTLAKVKTYLSIVGTGDDTLLDELIDNVTEWVEGMLGGRRIKETAYVDEEHDGGENDIFLRNWPIKSSPALTAEFRSGPLDNPTFTAFSVNEFIIYKGSGFVHFFARTAGRHVHNQFDHFGSPKIEGGHRNLRFTYTAGFDEIPADLDLLSKQLVGLLFKRRLVEGVKKEAVEGTSIEYSGIGSTSGDIGSLLTLDQRLIIKRYQRHNVGQNL